MPKESYEFLLVSGVEDLLKDFGYLWDPWVNGFRQTRNPERETTEQYLSSRPDVVSFEEMAEHGCLQGVKVLPDPLPWLERRLRAGKPID
jgi:hypothetical protein